jgi:hypothetical protein
MRVEGPEVHPSPAAAPLWKLPGCTSGAESRGRPTFPSLPGPEAVTAGPAPTPHPVPAMRQQITNFSVHQTAKVLAVLYGLMGLVFVPIFLVINTVSPDGEGIRPGLLILFPLLYAAFGYCFVAIGCAFYNFVAGRVGGIEVELNAESG